MTDTAQALDEVAKVADAVLFEGYLLYPYRASARKNQIRWQFGVLTPPEFGARTNEPSASRTEVLLEVAEPDTTLHVRLRFLQLEARTVLDAERNPVDELAVDDLRYTRFEEGIPREVDAVLNLADLAGDGQVVAIDLPPTTTSEPIIDSDAAVAGYLVRECWQLTGEIRLSTSPLSGPYDVLLLRVEVCNTTDAVTCAADTPREQALQYCLIAAHSVYALSSGAFFSSTNPPEWAKSATTELVNTHTWPVLAGAADRSDLLLSSPIILDDHPQLAPESPMDLFDGLENDEILTLRTMVLTDEEKREARATDPRAAAIIDSVDNMPPEIFERLHGAIRSMRAAPNGFSMPTMSPVADDVPTIDQAGIEKAAELPPWMDPVVDASFDPDTDEVEIDGIAVAKGSRVVLQPGKGSDAQDAFLDGMRATVQAVVYDVDGGVHLAVSIDDDPAADLQLAHGRFRYFRPDEVKVDAP